MFRKKRCVSSYAMTGAVAGAVIGAVAGTIVCCCSDSSDIPWQRLLNKKNDELDLLGKAVRRFFKNTFSI